MKRIAAIFILGAAFPVSARACAVCFGLGDNPSLPRAFFLGAMILIGFTFLMLGGLVYAAVRIERRRNSAEGARTWA